MSHPAVEDRLPVPARRRGFGSASDMVRSLVVVFALVALILVVTPRARTSSVRVVDWRQTYAQAVLSAGYPLYGPVGLGASWRATSARATPVARPADGSTATGSGIGWHVGFVTPRGASAAVEQSDGLPQQATADATDGGRPQGTVAVAGSTWRRYVRHRADTVERSLVRPAERSTLVVTGTAGWDELAQLATALRAR